MPLHCRHGAITEMKLAHRHAHTERHMHAQRIAAPKHNSASKIERPLLHVQFQHCILI